MLNNVSLSGVRAFESAARHGSFRAAAAELNLSPSAISHAILKLEQSLGTALFEREGRLVRLSPDGQTLMRHIGLAFDELRRGLELVSARGPELLRLHCAPSFASQWLSPRLREFFTSQPNLEVRLAANTDYARFTNDEFDADIVYGPVRAEAVDVISLGEEAVMPFCAPTLADAIRRPADLLEHVLIQSDVKMVRWPAWFEANGLCPPSTQGMRFDRSFLAIAAAVDGLGVALESIRLVERELKSGQLIAPLQGLSQDISYRAHFLVLPRARRHRRAVTTFVEWLLAELGLPSLLERQGVAAGASATPQKEHPARIGRSGNAATGLRLPAGQVRPHAVQTR